jgi:hypothetical protein
MHAMTDAMLDDAEENARDRRLRFAWLRRLAARGRRPQRICFELDAINALLAHCGKRPWQLSPADVDDWCEHLRQQRLPTEATLHAAHRAALRFMRFVFWECCTKCPSVTQRRNMFAANDSCELELGCGAIVAPSAEAAGSNVPDPDVDPQSSNRSRRK